MHPGFHTPNFVSQTWLLYCSHGCFIQYVVSNFLINSPLRFSFIHPVSCRKFISTVQKLGRTRATNVWSTRRSQWRNWPPFFAFSVLLFDSRLCLCSATCGLASSPSLVTLPNHPAQALLLPPFSEYHRLPRIVQFLVPPLIYNNETELGNIPYISSFSI